MAQFLRPNSTIADGGWTSTHTAIDEATPNDGDYIQATGTGDTDFVVGLSDPQNTPGVDTGHIIRWRAMALGSGAGEQVNVILKQGSTTIASSGNTSASRTAFTDYSFTLTEAEAANITDYSALTITLTPNIQSGAEWLRLSWLEMEVPDAGGGVQTIPVAQTTSAHASQAHVRNKRKTLGQARR